MDILDAPYFDRPIDIRARVSGARRRERRLAQLNAPADWHDQLRAAIAETQGPRPLWFSSADAKMFLNSFAIFFVAAMAFLI